jgi:toxin ParE1/3/4
VAHRVVWSGRALADVEAIAAYIAEDSPAYARSVVRRIIASTRNLAEFPLSGRKVPEFDDDEIREVLVQSYRVIYRVRAGALVVAAVVHGRRDLDE